jgi:hypothetical protein
MPQRSGSTWRPENRLLRSMVAAKIDVGRLGASTFSEPRA